MNKRALAGSWGARTLSARRGFSTNGCDVTRIRAFCHGANADLIRAFVGVDVYPDVIRSMVNRYVDSSIVLQSSNELAD